MAGYHVYRNGAVVGSTSGTTYADSGLSPSTTYTYTVAAYDPSNNLSAQSQPVVATTLPATTGSAYPLNASANNRYLVDQNNVPFLLVGDSPHSLLVNVSTSDMDYYFATRVSQGFNAAWVQVLCDAYTGGRADGSTYDGIAPFTTLDHLDTPNASYFARLETLVQTAANHGIVVFLDPVDTGGWLSTLLANGGSVDRGFGQYLGNRYRNSPNIVWLNGNDFGNWTDPGSDFDVQAVALGIKDNDMNHIHTIELGPPLSASLDDSSWTSIISLDAAYTYKPTYAEVLQEYNRSGFKPVFMVEANYEGESLQGDTGTPNILRRQEYWSMLSGAAGQLYGNGAIWPFPANWKSNLNSTGAVQIGYMKALFGARRWYDLVPDQNHTVVTAGYGTFSSTGTIAPNNYATAASTSDGALVMAYMPTTLTLTVDMTKLSGSATARWYDPTNGNYTTISGSPFANSGTHQFAPPGNNSAGDGDWVLVLEVP